VKYYGPVLALAAVSVVACSVLLLQQQRRLEARLPPVSSTPIILPMLSTLTATWTSGGILRTLTTTRNPNETLDAFTKRHEDELAAALKRFPRDQ
jgi:hypothetical protein